MVLYNGVVSLGLLHYRSEDVTLGTFLLKNRRNLDSITGGSNDYGVGLRPAYGVALDVALGLTFGVKPLPCSLRDGVVEYSGEAPYILRYS